jgi:hypothetical protein
MYGTLRNRNILYIYVYMSLRACNTGCLQPLLLPLMFTRVIVALHAIYIYIYLPFMYGTLRGRNILYININMYVRLYEPVIQTVLQLLFLHVMYTQVMVALLAIYIYIYIYK